MNNSLTWWVALVGGVGGAIVGCLGGLVGCACSVRNTNGPRERGLMIRASVLCFLGVSCFLALLWALPATFRPLVWLPYPFALIWGIRTINRKQAEVREQEAGADVGTA